MSATTLQAYTKKTLSKALSWLEQQPKDWDQHITADTAVRLYLKVQNEEKEKNKENPFVKELKKYCNNTVVTEKESPDIKDGSTDQGAVIKDISSKLDTQPEHSLPPAKPLNLNKQMEISLLDLKSKDLIEKTRENFNLSSSEEALRMLIQVGYKSLKPLASN